MDDEKRITIRVPLRIWEGLRRLARRDRRSLNTYLVVLLEQHVERDGDGRPADPPNG